MVGGFYRWPERGHEVILSLIHASISLEGHLTLRPFFTGRGNLPFRIHSYMVGFLYPVAAHTAEIGINEFSVILFSDNKKPPHLAGY